MRSLGCPRYGKKGSPTAIYDDDPDDDEDGSIFEEMVQDHIEDWAQDQREMGLSDRDLSEDLSAITVTPTGPETDILVRGRRTYRQRLYDIIMQVGDENNANVADGMDGQRSKAMVKPVFTVAMMALVSLDLFTEHDLVNRYLYAVHLETAAELFDQSLPEITSGQFAQFSGLATIVTAYQLAVDGRIGELRDYLYTQRRMRLL